MDHGGHFSSHLKVSICLNHTRLVRQWFCPAFETLHSSLPPDLTKSATYTDGSVTEKQHEAPMAMTSLHLLKLPICTGTRSTHVPINVAAARACLSVDANAADPLKAVVAVGSQEVMEAEQKVMVGTYKRPPLVVSSGKGCKLYDPEGREYLDLYSGIAVNALGHGDPDWIRVVTEQAHTLTHVSNAFYSIPQVK